MRGQGGEIHITWDHDANSHSSYSSATCVLIECVSNYSGHMRLKSKSCVSLQQEDT